MIEIYLNIKSNPMVEVNILARKDICPKQNNVMLLYVCTLFPSIIFLCFLCNDLEKCIQNHNHQLYGVNASLENMLYFY